MTVGGTAVPEAKDEPDGSSPDELSGDEPDGDIVEVTYVDPISAGKLSAAISAVASVFVYLGLLTGETTGGWITFLLVPMVVIGGGAVVGFLSAAIGVSIYNIVADEVGGIEVAIAE